MVRILEKKHSGSRRAEHPDDVLSGGGGRHRTASTRIAEIPGTDLADEVVIMGAHFDTTPGATGATDNATGSAAMMEAVRIIKSLGLRPRRTIRVALWGGEEQGLLGSRAYVAEHYGTEASPKPAHAKVAAYYNLDNGTGKIRGIWGQGNLGAMALFREWIESVEDLGVEIVGPRSVGATDHASFDSAGIPGIPVHSGAARIQLAHASLEHGFRRSRAARRSGAAGGRRRRLRVVHGELAGEACRERSSRVDPATQ